MKKNYTKPEILFEDFSLNTSITAGCELKTAHPSYVQNCGYQDPRFPNDIIFAPGTLCTSVYEDQVYDGYCYHVPVDDHNLFNS